MSLFRRYGCVCVVFVAFSGALRSSRDAAYVGTLDLGNNMSRKNGEVWIYHKKDKNEAKRTKPSTRMERAQKTKAEGPRWKSPAFLLVDGTWHLIQGLRMIDIEVVWNQWLRLEAVDTPEALDPSAHGYKWSSPSHSLDV
ncbi:hypothetical protein Tco_0496927 [Tanacetum coccineum]